MEEKGGDGKRWRIRRGTVEKDEEDAEARNGESGGVERGEVENGKSLVGLVGVDQPKGGGDQGEQEQGKGEQAWRSS